MKKTMSTYSTDTVVYTITEDGVRIKYRMPKEFDDRAELLPSTVSANEIERLIDAEEILMDRLNVAEEILMEAVHYRHIPELQQSYYLVPRRAMRQIPNYNLKPKFIK